MSLSQHGCAGSAHGGCGIETLVWLAPDSYKILNILNILKDRHGNLIKRRATFIATDIGRAELVWIGSLTSFLASLGQEPFFYYMIQSVLGSKLYATGNTAVCSVLGKQGKKQIWSSSRVEFH